MKHLLILLLAGFFFNAANANIFYDIQKNAEKDPELFWSKNKYHIAPSLKILDEKQYESVNVKPNFTVLGDEASACIECDVMKLKNYVDEYMFNMFLRIATKGHLSYMQKCQGDYNTFIGLDYIGVFDPLFINRNFLSELMNTQTTFNWFMNNSKLKEMFYNRLGINFDKESMEYKKCIPLFLNILAKNMSYYGVNKSLSISNPDRTKVEPLYYYSTSLNNETLDNDSGSLLNGILYSALNKCAPGGVREFVCYKQQQNDYSDFDRFGTKKITIVNTYTYRPVRNECRPLSYLIGSELIVSRLPIQDIYEIWALPHVLKNKLIVKPDAKLMNEKTPSKKWDYHVAIVAVINNVPVVLDGLFFNKTVTLKTWQDLFDPSTRFMTRPFVRAIRLENSFCTQEFIKKNSATPHKINE